MSRKALWVCMAASLLAGAPAASAALPGRDGAIAFSSIFEGEDCGPGGTGTRPGFSGCSYSIFRVQPSGKKQQRLSACGTQANPECSDGLPAWSPKGSRIVFGHGGELWTMKADGTDARSLGLTGAEPVWAPDGRRLALIQDERLVVVNSDGTGLKVITPEAYIVDFPSWSSRNLIAFSRNTGGGTFDLMTVRPDGGARRRVLKGCACFKPDFSPRGDRIVFGGYFDATGLETVGVDGKNRRRILSRGRQPAFSPAGTRIVYSRGPELYIARGDGSRAHRIAYDVKRELGGDIAGSYDYPAWQPLP
jgi:Tol biopolymer transport system component